MRFDREILDIISRFESAGHEAYVVGGSLRDRLLGRRVNDVDMTASALPEQTVSLFADMRVIPTGIKHGTVTVLTPSGAAIEITTFRTDGSYSDSRHPDSVTFTRSLDDDLARRDFTVNAMAYSPRRGVVDLFGGASDLEARVIRCVGEPEKRFTEDALRILRAFRFSAQLGFSIEEKTLSAALKLGERISMLARERVAAELMKLLGAPRVGDVLIAMNEIMPYVLPKADIDRERLALCDRLDPDPIARLALLVYGGNANAVSSGLRMSNSDKHRLCSLSTARELPKSEGDARRMLAELGSRDDCIAAVNIVGLISGEDASAALKLVSLAADNSPCLSMSELAVGGGELIAMGVERGRQVGQILRCLLDAVIEDQGLNERETLLGMAREMMDK